MSHPQIYKQLKRNMGFSFSYSFEPAALSPDVPRPQGPGVHLSHRFLRVHRGGAMGRPDHLQDAPQLHRTPGHAQLGAQLRHPLRDRARRLPVLHSRNGQGAQDVPTQVSTNSH